MTDDQLNSIVETIKQLFSFAMLSATGLFLNLSFLALTNKLGFLELRIVIGYLIQITNNFYWLRRFTFEYTEKSVIFEYSKFVLTMSTGGVIYTLLSLFLIIKFGIFYLLATFMSTLISGLFNFIFSKIWVFRLSSQKS